ncbi:putative tyrosine-protein phosphatase [Hibiscus syriacus]|uniref:Tyrosine-protein phosphatase n=1 Tax=Hibiscus syriacus TaxID=106335 RepID=A0A6A3CMZ2_HIBSY|nr:putative tyrosine-protein phosphatase [Hibiscus syriacus]
MPTSEPPQTPPLSEQSETQPPQTLLDLITGVLSILLLSSLSVRSFVGRWQVVRHFQRLKALSDQCTLSSFAGGKLLMQSDLDMASASLSNHLQDLDLLLRSGVLHQSNAIVLSQPGPGSDKDDLVFFVRDLFTRLQIGGIEFKKKALESLLQLLNKDEKSTAVVAKEGNVRYLISLLEVNSQPLIRDQAVLAVSILASSSEDSRKIIFEEGGLGPLLRILETGSIPLKEKAAIAVEAITADPENAWAVSAYGGVSVLIEACRSGSQPTQTHAVGALRNVASVEDIRMALGEEGAVPIVVQLLDSGTTAAQEKAANCLSILASSETTEHVLRTISSLSVTDSISRTLSSSTVFIIQLGEFIKHGNTILQQISASFLSKLSISDGNKRAISSCMGSLVKLIESPKPVGLQDAAVQAIVSLLTVRSNRKDLVRDEKSVMRLVQMLDPKNEAVSKKYPLMVLTAVLGGGRGGCRKRLVAAGANKHIQSLAEMEVAGAKKALQRLAENRLKTIFSQTWRQ